MCIKLVSINELTIYDNCILHITRKYIGTSHKIPVSRTIRVPNKLVQISLLTKQYIAFVPWKFYDQFCKTYFWTQTIIIFLNWCAGLHLHTKRSSIHSDIYQMSYWYNQFSWWWAHGCPKHVENRNKHELKKNCASSWLFFFI